MDLHLTYAPEGVCISAQFLITAIAILRIRDNQDEFPVRQLGPGSTIICILCFFLSNLFLIIGRIIVQYQTIASPCKTHFNNSLYALGILYNITRQLPFPLFTIKILRVSLCFWPVFNKINVQKINKTFVQILKNQTYFAFICLAYVSVVILLMAGVYGSNPTNSYLIYQYFCPKTQSTGIQQTITAIRFLSLVFVFILSLWTYQQLDFKKFLILISLTASLSIIPHLFISLGKYIYNYQVNLRDSIYYTSFIIQLLNSCIVFFYNSDNKQLNQPAMQGVLQSWQAFHNLRLGMTVLLAFAQHKDNNTQNNKYNFRCLDSYDYLDQILKQCVVNKNFSINYELQGIEKILQRNQYVKMKLGEGTTKQFQQKCLDGTLNLQNIRKIEKILSIYCETVIFAEWKKTNSYKFLKQQFINNGDINQKLGLFGIPVS